MDQLPLEVLRHILSLTDLRDKLLLMRVNRAFQAACRSLVAGQRTLVLYIVDGVTPVRKARQTLSLPLLSSDATSCLWISLQRTSSLVSLTICNQFVGGHEAAVTAVVAANAAHLRELRFTDEMNCPMDRHHRLACLHQVPLPQLRVMTGCREADVDFLVTHSPLLQEISVCDTVFSPRDMESLARLEHLQSFQMRVCDLFDNVGPALLTLLRGASRFALRDIYIQGMVFDFDEEGVARELDSIQQVTGRRPLVSLPPPPVSCDSSDEDSSEGFDVDGDDEDLDYVF